MLEIKGSIWNFHSPDNWVGVTTNSVIKRNGQAVMGAGIALDASRRFPELPARLAKHLTEGGNHPYIFPQYRIVTIPTKHHWKDKSDIDLIESSCKKLIQCADHFSKLYIPRLGCGNGGLSWNDVRNRISSILDDRFIVVSLI
jgi:hypothetical protein